MVLGVPYHKFITVNNWTFSPALLFLGAPYHKFITIHNLTISHALFRTLPCHAYIASQHLNEYRAGP